MNTEVKNTWVYSLQVNSHKISADERLKMFEKENWFMHRSRKISIWSDGIHIFYGRDGWRSMEGKIYIGDWSIGCLDNWLHMRGYTHPRLSCIAS